MIPKFADEQLDESLWETFPASDSAALSHIEDIDPHDVYAYNYSHFRAKHYNSFSLSSPALESIIPNLTLFNLDGDAVSLHDYLNEGMVIELGSVTSPMYRANVAPMNELMNLFPNRSFVVIYVREAHPGNLIGPHRRLTQKLSHARNLACELGDRRTILVDGVDGHAHKALGSLPNSCFMTNARGIITYKASWCRPPHVHLLLSGLLLGPSQRPQNGLVSLHMPPVRHLVAGLKRGGRQAVVDFVRAYPALAYRQIKLKSCLKGNDSFKRLRHKFAQR